MCHLVPGSLPCPEVVAVFYIRPAEVPTLFSVGGDAQVEQQNTVVGFLTFTVACPTDEILKSTTKELRISDMVNFVLFFAVDCDWVRGRWR